MPSARSILIASVASASAQYTTTVSVSGYDQGMPTLSSYSSPQGWQQWNTYGGWSSSATAVTSYATSAASSVYPTSSLSTYVPVPVGSSTYGSASVSTSSAPYENPFTVYLTQTNSMGVVTGMPTVVTSQPSVVTSQPVVATTPAGVLPSAPVSNTTLVTSSRPTTSSSSNQSQSSTTSAFIGTATGAGAKDTVSGAGLALVIAGMAFSLL